MQNGLPNAHNRRDRQYDRESANDYYTRHDPNGSAKLSTTVVHALADVMEVDVSDTGFTLYDCVDPDALDRLFTRGVPGATGHVAFSVEGYQVTVYGDGQIVITPPRRSQ